MNFGAQVFLNDVYKRSLVPRRVRSPLPARRPSGRDDDCLSGDGGGGDGPERDRHRGLHARTGLGGVSANWAQWWWWRFNGQARLAASFGGPLVFLVNQFVVFRYVVDAGESSAYLVVFASIARPPRCGSPSRWQRRRSRPRSWSSSIDAPVRSACGGPSPGWRACRRWAPRRLHAVLGIAAAGAAMVGALVIALTMAYVARWQVAAMAVTLSAIAGIGFKKWFRPFVDRPRAEHLAASTRRGRPKHNGQRARRSRQVRVAG